MQPPALDERASLAPTLAAARFDHAARPAASHDAAADAAAGDAAPHWVDQDFEEYFFD